MSNTKTAPPGWWSSAIGDICIFSRGVFWKKSQERRSPTVGAVPVLRIPNVQRTLELTNLMYIDGLTRAQQTKARVKEGWTLLVGSNGNPKRVGNCVFVAEPRDFLFASFLIGAKPNDPDRVDSEFLYRLLSSGSVQNDIWQSVQGSTGLCNIDLNMLKALHVPIPPLPEQRKIAAILSSVDDAIEKTQAVIDQVEVVKRGLMQELLTRGLPGRHTRFKQTEIGEIPEEWRILPLVRLSEDGIRNGVFKKKSEFGSGVRLINVFDVYQNLQVAPSALRRVNVTPNERDKFSARPGDLFFVRSSLKKEGIGKCCVVTKTDEPLVFECHIMRVRVRQSQADPLFLAYQCDSNGFRRRLMARAKTVTMTTIDQTGLGSLSIAYPPLEEQRRISRILAELDWRGEIENKNVALLRRVKSALMSVLLSGELRVTPDPEVA